MCSLEAIDPKSDTSLQWSIPWPTLSETLGRSIDDHMTRIGIASIELVLESFSLQCQLTESMQADFSLQRMHENWKSGDVGSQIRSARGYMSTIPTRQRTSVDWFPLGRWHPKQQGLRDIASNSAL